MQFQVFRFNSFFFPPSTWCTVRKKKYNYAIIQLGNQLAAALVCTDYSLWLLFFTDRSETLVWSSAIVLFPPQVPLWPALELLLKHSNKMVWHQHLHGQSHQDCIFTQVQIFDLSIMWSSWPASTSFYVLYWCQIDNYMNVHMSRCS